MAATTQNWQSLAAQLCFPADTGTLVGESNFFQNL